MTSPTAAGGGKREGEEAPRSKRRKGDLSPAAAFGHRKRAKVDRRPCAETEGEITPICVFLSRSAGDGTVKVLRFLFGTGLAGEGEVSLSLPQSLTDLRPLVPAPSSEGAKAAPGT